MIAGYLKQLRQHAQVTTGEWAAKSGISRSTLWRWEQSKTLPRDEELRLALDALSVSPVERLRAVELLQKERVASGVGSILPLVGTGLKRNELLRALRLRLGWSQSEAAARLRVNRVTLANWERGDHWPETTLLHQACQLYRASHNELIALTTLSVPSGEELPTDPNDVTWDDIETYNGDFRDLELRYLTNRALLARMPQAFAREREMHCTLDYLHSFLIQSRAGDARRELRRIAANPVLLASPALFARHKFLYAISQKETPRSDIVAEETLEYLLGFGDAVPVGERSRAKAEWAERRGRQGDRETALRLSASAFADAEASGDPDLLSINQRQRTANLIIVGEFNAAAQALERFPTHTPLFAVQRLFTYAMLLHKADSRIEAITAYGDAARAAQAAGMVGYANVFNQFAVSLAVD